jgi:hypothetical protein
LIPVISHADPFGHGWLELAATRSSRMAAWLVRVADGTPGSWQSVRRP